MTTLILLRRGAERSLDGVRSSSLSFVAFGTRRAVKPGSIRSWHRFSQGRIADGSSQPQLPPAGDADSAKIAIAPVIGSPDAVARQICRRSLPLRSATPARQRRDSSRTTKAEYTLRGYIVVARARRPRHKVSYIWDVTDQRQARQPHHRRRDRRSVQEKDPWAAVTPQVVQSHRRQDRDTRRDLAAERRGIPVATSRRRYRRCGSRCDKPAAAHDQRPTNAATAPLHSRRPRPPAASPRRADDARWCRP